MKNFKKNTMIKFDDASDIVVGSARRLGTERVDIDRVLNRVLAEDVASDVDMPPFAKSAMDGFACHRADLAKELEVIETIPAGSWPERTIGQGQCAKIMTGAVVPEGADCVIMKEYVEMPTESTIRFIGEKTDGNICLKAEDVKKGDVVLRAGEIIETQHIAVLASCGCVEPLVALQPRVGIIATGDELVEPAKKPAACQIRNSNGFQLAAHVASVGAIARNYGIAADTEEATDRMVKKAMAENNVLILSGGVSVGDYDLVRGILEKNNVKLQFEKVAVKPGRPTVFGVSDDVFCFGLPGNPVSTFVTFELLVKPFLYKMMGHNFKPAVARGQLERTIERKKTERDSWLPVVFTKNGKVAGKEYHGSAHINALCEADGLVCIPAGVAEIKEGTTVAVRQI
ncbi:gephyrin-like molybdotransferase Glp [Planctomycetota bacterium]